MSTVLASPAYYLDGWAGNVRDDYGVAWVVEEETGWSDGAPVRLSTADAEGADGGTSGPVLLGPRLITLKGRAFAPDQMAMLAAKDRLKSVAFRSDRYGRYDLVVEEAHVTRRASVKPFTNVMARDLGTTKFAWEIGLRADDPIRYAVSPSGATLELPSETVGGLRFPIRFPLTFNSAGTGEGSAFLTNAGDIDVLPYVTIYGPVTNPVIQNVTTGRSLAFTPLTLAASEYLMVDFRAKTVLLNGTANRRRAKQPGSVWWPLVPGVNEIRYRASAYTPSTTQITFSSGWK